MSLDGHDPAPGPKLLAIDCGTQSVRALLFDLDGELVARRRVTFEPCFSAEPGWAEQETGVFWDALCEACQGLWSQPGVEPGEIAGVALTTQRGTVVNLDADGHPLRPAIIWLDQRRTANPPRLPAPIEWGAAATGAARIVNEFRVQAECNWIAENEPEIWRNTERFLLLSGFLSWRLCGEFVDSTGCQVGFVPFDFKRHQWARPRDPRWSVLTVRREQLPELVPPGERLGTITEEAAAATGIPAGLPLIAAAADKACEVLGSGCIDPSVGHVSYGTTATFNTSNDRYVEASRRMPAYPSAIPGRWNTERQLTRGYWLVTWFKNEFAHPETIAAEQLGVEPESLFEELLTASKPGAAGLVLQPYWSSVARMPGPEARGAVIGFGELHTRADLYRSIVEGIGYAMREAGELLQKRNGVKIERLRVSGGGSASEHAMRITADIFGLPVERPRVTETSGLGAAINAAVGLGLHESYDQALARMTHVGDTFEPDPTNHQLYSQIFTQVYGRLYGRLKPFYKSLRTITGYPP